MISQQEYQSLRFPAIMPLFMPMTELSITFEDEALLILNKPPGLLSVPGKTEPHCLHTVALDYNANCRVVHRLDMATSGLVIFAKSHAAQKAMGHLFERRNISKCYHAIVQGQPSQSCGDVELPLICDWPNRPKQKVCFEEGKKAHTRFQVRQTWPTDDCSLLELTPITGRSHQLRVHCQELGHPILGDNLYNGGVTQTRSRRLLLHAAELKFEHPLTGEALHIEEKSGFERPERWLASNLDIGTYNSKT